MPASAGMTVGHSVIPANAGISFVVKIQNPPVSEVLLKKRENACGLKETANIFFMIIWYPVIQKIRF